MERVPRGESLNAGSAAQSQVPEACNGTRDSSECDRGSVIAAQTIKDFYHSLEIEGRQRYTKATSSSKGWMKMCNHAGSVQHETAAFAQVRLLRTPRVRRQVCCIDA